MDEYWKEEKRYPLLSLGQQRKIQLKMFNAWITSKHLTKSITLGLAFIIPFIVPHRRSHVTFGFAIPFRRRKVLTPGKLIPSSISHGADDTVKVIPTPLVRDDMPMTTSLFNVRVPLSILAVGRQTLFFTNKALREIKRFIRYYLIFKIADNRFCSRS